MNNRIMAMLFALVAAMFISIVPVKAEAAEAQCKHVHNYVSCEYWQCQCADQAAHNAALTNGTCHAITFRGTNPCKWADKNGQCYDPNGDCKCNICGSTVHNLKKVDKVEPTCRDKGLEAHYECTNASGCKGWYKDAGATVATTKSDLTIANLGHQWKWDFDEKIHKQVCTAEGCTASQNKANHNLTTKDAEDGSNHITSCACGYEVTAKHYDTYEDCWCDACGVELEHKPAKATPKSSVADEHAVYCSVEKCGKKLDEGKCEFDYAQLEYGKGEHGQHKVECTVCGRYNNTEDCFDKKDDHYCDGCGGHMKHKISDTSYMTYKAKDPTCTEEGIYEHYECRVCGLLLDTDAKLFTKDTVMPALGHKAGSSWFYDETEHYKLCYVCFAKTGEEHAEVKIEDTIAEHDLEWFAVNDNLHYAECKVCDYMTVTFEHDYSEPVYEKYNGVDAHKRVCETCNHVLVEYCKDADQNCVCDACGTLKTHDIKPLKTVAGKDASCTAAGVKTHYSCNFCKNIFFFENGKCLLTNAAGTVIPATGHKWIKGGTDVADGRHIMKCANSANGVSCDKGTVMNHYTNDGDCYCDVEGCTEVAHSHKLIFVSAKEATCTEAGSAAYYKYEACGKMFDMYQNEISAPVATPAAGHDFGDEWVPCEGGVHAKFCANCDEFISEEHSFRNGNVQCSVCGGEEELTHVAAKAATCTENGNVEYWTSLITGKKYADAAGNTLIKDATVKATGHNMSGWEDLANGVGHKKVCMNAGCTHTENGAHDNANGCFCTECGGFKTGHSNELVNAVPATCAKAGTQAHFKCSCGKLYDLGFNAIDKAGSIAQLKHVMDPTVKKDAKEGKHYIQCKDCSYKLYENHGMELSDPNKGNYHQWLCECGELKIETHYDKNGDKKCDVCGHNMGTTSTKVEQHDNKTVYTGQSDTVNVHKDWFWNWQEVFTPSNSGGSSTTVTESATESNTANSGTATGNTATGNTTTGSTATGNTATGNTATGNTTTGNTASSNSGNTSAPTVSAPAATQTNILVQFVSWFLGLFGF